MLVPQPIHAGDTALASTLTVEQTGPLQLTVRAGTFTTIGDAPTGVPSEDLILLGDLPYVLSSDPTLDKTYLLELGLLNGMPDILCRSQLAGEAMPAPPAGWEPVQWLAQGVVPAGATTLDAAPFRVFTVLPGFPAGTVAADWQIQRGVV
jgi:hypothetical protein